MGILQDSQKEYSFANKVVYLAPKKNLSGMTKDSPKVGFLKAVMN